MATTLTLDKRVLDAIDMSPLIPFVSWHEHRRYFDDVAGREHYRLLAHLSRTLSCGRLLDIGCYLGHSAVALSADPTKEVLSFDIIDHIPSQEHGVKTAKDRPNVRIRYCDYLRPLGALVEGCDLVVLDIDHTGHGERLIMDRLRAVSYGGMVLLDDIDLNDDMRRFFAEIPEKKVVVTPYGHWSGSAIVLFDPARFDVLCA